MTKIWYVKEGPRPNNTVAGPELIIDQCIKLFGVFEIKYLGQEPPEFSSNRNNFTGYRGPKYVVLEIDSSEAAQNKSPFNKEGFFFVCDLTPDKARNILEQHNLVG